MKYYIAYGSNLSVRQMAVRCSDAKVVGKAILPDWKLGMLSLISSFGLSFSTFSFSHSLTL